MVWTSVGDCLPPYRLLPTTTFGLDQSSSSHPQPAGGVPPQFPAVRMADRVRERIGSVRARIAWKREQPPHHVLHLVLGRVPLADDRLIDLQRGVFNQGESCEHRGA